MLLVTIPPQGEQKIDPDTCKKWGMGNRVMGTVWAKLKSWGKQNTFYFDNTTNWQRLRNQLTIFGIMIILKIITKNKLIMCKKMGDVPLNRLFALPQAAAVFQQSF
jgi:hypothetical protein